MIKSTELQIGDWVYDTILKGNTRVEILSSSGIRGDFHENVWHENTFEPIPLTPEILEKNGFYRNGIEDSDEMSINIDYGGWSYENKDGFDVLGDGQDIKFVHELQHALKLCGIEKEIEL